MIGLEIATVPLTAPIYLIIAAIAVLAGLAFLVWRNWEPITKWFAGVWDNISNLWKGMPLWMQILISLPMTIITHWKEISAFFVKAWDTIQGVFKSGVDAVWNVLPDWFKSILKGAAFAVNFGINPVGAVANSGVFKPRGPRGPAAPGIAMAAPVGTLSTGHAATTSTVNHAFAPQQAEVNVKFDNAPANMAVTKISSSPNQKLTVNTGKQGPRK
jgi:hypothetical protein